MPSERPRLTVYFDSDETKCALEAIANADDRAASNYVLRLIKQAIRQAEAQGLLQAQQLSESVSSNTQEQHG